MIDFTNLPTSNKLYAGADGPKRAVMYQGKKYLLKFPAASSKNKNSCHANSSIAEYIGCHIFNSIGIRAQETTLGVYRKNGAEKIVVACKDFTSLGVVLQDFASLKNSVIDSKHSCYSTELSEIIQAMEAQSAFPPAFLKRHFWDLFIVDALIHHQCGLRPWAYQVRQRHRTFRGQLSPQYEAVSDDDHEALGSGIVIGYGKDQRKTDAG